MKQISQRRRLFILMVVLCALVGLTVWQGSASAPPPHISGELARLPDDLAAAAVSAPPSGGRVLDQALPRIQSSAFAPFAGGGRQAAAVSNGRPEQDEIICYQALLNPELDVLVFDDGTGTAEPWVIIDPEVYYDDEPGFYVSPSYSLAMVDADAGDGSPTQDAFGQAFVARDNLLYVEVDYDVMMTEMNATDNVLGNLWTLDENGDLKTFVDSWEVGETADLAWEGRYYAIDDPAILSQMSGQRMAVLLFNQTDGMVPGEIVWFDDVALYTCVPVPNTQLFMPSHNLVRGLQCVPPQESPPDSWYAARGYVSAGSECDTTLSDFDDRDYYNFKPEISGNYTIVLRNLPDGSNWSASVYNDTDPPPSGPTNGSCYTSQSGDVNKSVTCSLQATKSYVVKVSAGSTPMKGSYELLISGP